MLKWSLEEKLRAGLLQLSNCVTPAWHISAEKGESGGRGQGGGDASVSQSQKVVQHAMILF